jgi:plasmid maintenance system antidote protein VapI/Zn-dependent peptidase ImmA (M78 family)
MVDERPFSPDWVSAPGETIAALLKERGVTPDDFAVSLHKPRTEVDGLLSGQTAITPDVASLLAAVLGASIAFWLGRERRYREGLERLQVRAAEAASAGWLSQIPVSDMVRLGWLPARADHVTTAAAALQFFGVPDVASWQRRYQDVLQAIAFRTSPTFESLPGAVAAWLRQGEHLAASIRCEPWDAERLRSALPAIRALTREKDPQVFLPELTRLCAECGVAVVVLRAPKSCKASGATKFITPQKPLLMLSFRYLSDDHFWFTFFHEAGHLLLHGDRVLFLEGDDRLSTAEEEEANAFAASTLVPADRVQEMVSLPADGVKVVRFAKSVGISPGIVVGQLQHRGVLRRNQLNNLKRRYEWVSEGE